MVDGIKSDEMTASLATAQASQASAKRNTQTDVNSTTSSTTPNKGVIVTSHMSQLVNIMMDNVQAPDENARVQAMKSQVQSNNYQVNIPALADKLASTVLANA